MRIVVAGNAATDKLANRARRTLRRVAAFLNCEGYVEVNLVGDAVMKKNVLSYPAPAGFPRPDAEEVYLGEIYLNPGYIKERGEDFDLMLIHGFLHLLGYDHKKKSDTMKMEKTEDKLLSFLRV